MVVSIPIGFSSSLQRPEMALQVAYTSCFNPYRVFKFVATSGSGCLSPWPLQFQSLSGFQVRCNGGQANQLHARWCPVSIPIGFSSSLQLNALCLDGLLGLAVSIPIGFSSSLQPPCSSVCPLHPQVSIPIGFSSSLQRSLSRAFLWHSWSFNPYRVFKFVATPRHPAQWHWNCFRFNPYRVFKFVATYDV